jgi:hypothetical protein
MKWSLRNHSRLNRAMSRLRGSIETRRVLDELEWHRWFAWYPVVVARDNERAYWAWLQFVERKTHLSRSTGEWILRYRSALRRAERAAHEPRTNRQNSARADTTPKTITSSPTIQQVQPAGSAGYRNPAIDVVVFKATAILDLADYIVSDLNRQKRHARLVPSVHSIVEHMKEPINGQWHTIEDLKATRRQLQEQAANFNDMPTQAAAAIALKKIDSYLRSIPQGDVLMSNVAAAKERSNIAHAKLAGRVQGKFDTQARPSGPGNNRRNRKNGR